MVKILEFDGQFRITIPNDIMKHKDWKKGQIIYFQLNKQTGEVKLIDLFERMIGEYDNG